MPMEVEWLISPHVMHDIMTIIAKHGMGFPDMDEDMRQALFGSRLFGPDAAAMEIREKYNLHHLPFGTQIKIVVDYKMEGYETPK